MADVGVIHVMYAGRERVVREGHASASQLRKVMQPTFKLELLANQRADTLLQKWSEVAQPWDAKRIVGLHPRIAQLGGSLDGDDVAAYYFKLSGLLSTRFNRTVFLDCDIFVLRPSLVQQLLFNALSVSDVAMPIDPGRAAHLVISSPGAEPPPWVAPSVGPPMLCSAVLAYRRSAIVEDFFVGAARRLREHSHPTVRQGDQEMMWYQWRFESRDLRMLALPEETYCPLEHRQRPDKAWRRSSTWRTSWRRGVYPCAAVHGHAFTAPNHKNTTAPGPRSQVRPIVPQLVRAGA